MKIIRYFLFSLLILCLAFPSHALMEKTFPYPSSEEDAAFIHQIIESWLPLEADHEVSAIVIAEDKDTVYFDVFLDEQTLSYVAEVSTDRKRVTIYTLHYSSEGETYQENNSLEHFQSLLNQIWSPDRFTNIRVRMRSFFKPLNIVPLEQETIEDKYVCILILAIPIDTDSLVFPAGSVFKYLYDGEINDLTALTIYFP